MEIKEFDCDLKDWIQAKPTRLNLGFCEVFEAQFAELSYVFNSSKRLVLQHLCQEALSSCDLVIWIDANMDAPLLEGVKVFQVFSLPEMVMRVCALPELLRNTRAKACLILDSFNTFLHNDHLDFSKESKKQVLAPALLAKMMHDSLLAIKEEFGTIGIIAKKEHFPKRHKIKASEFEFYHYDSASTTKLFDTSFSILDPVIGDDRLIYHSISQKQVQINVCVFNHPTQVVYQGLAHYI